MVKTDFRIWQKKQMIGLGGLWLAGALLAAFMPEPASSIGVVWIVLVAALFFLFDPKGAATMRGVIDWGDVDHFFSGDDSTKTIRHILPRVGYWILFAAFPIVVLVLAWVQRPAQMVAWRNALALMQAEVDTWHNPALDRSAPDATNTPASKAEPLPEPPAPMRVRTRAKRTTPQDA